MSRLTKTTACRHCGDQIAWVRTTTSGKPMPVDPDPVESGNVIVRYENGALVAEVLTRSETRRPQGIAFIPHFATCRELNKTRKTKPPKPPKPVPPPQPDLFS